MKKAVITATCIILRHFSKAAMAVGLVALFIPVFAQAWPANNQAYKNFEARPSAETFEALSESQQVYWVEKGLARQFLPQQVVDTVTDPARFAYDYGRSRISNENLRKAASSWLAAVLFKNDLPYAQVDELYQLATRDERGNQTNVTSVLCSTVEGLIDMSDSTNSESQIGYTVESLSGNLHAIVRLVNAQPNASTLMNLQCKGYDGNLSQLFDSTKRTLREMNPAAFEAGQQKVEASNITHSICTESQTRQLLESELKVAKLAKSNSYYFRVQDNQCVVEGNFTRVSGKIFTFTKRGPAGTRTITTEHFFTSDELMNLLKSKIEFSNPMVETRPRLETPQTSQTVNPGVSR